jgi:glycosyltransferase involved in cell wall biosynthesis
MRIGFVSPHYMPYKGGIETLVQAIAERMAAWGHQVDVLTLATSAKLPDRQEVNRVMVRRFRERISGDAYPLGLPLLLYLFAHRGEYEVVNAHNYHALPLLWCNLAAVHPLVVSTHYHGQGHSRFANGLHPLYRPLGSWAVRHAQAVICASKFERDLVCAHLRVEKEKIEIVPDGVTLNALHAAKQLELKASALLYVGRLEKYKRVDLAIASLSYLPEGFRLYIIGKGPEEEALRTQARQVKVDHRVEFMKDIPDDMLYRWYRSARVLVMMSEAESFPMTSIEAIATGCRVVCSARSPFTELAYQLPEAIFLLQDPTPINLAEEVRRVAGLPGRAEADLNKFDWDSIARETLNIFERVSTSKVGLA